MIISFFEVNLLFSFWNFFFKLWADAEARPPFPTD